VIVAYSTHPLHAISTNRQQKESMLPVQYRSSLYLQILTHHLFLTEALPHFQNADQMLKKSISAIHQTCKDILILKLKFALPFCLLFAAKEE